MDCRDFLFSKVKIEASTKAVVLCWVDMKILMLFESLRVPTATGLSISKVQAMSPLLFGYKTDADC